MNTVNFKGVGQIDGGEYGTVSVDGVCNCSGDIKAESIIIDGVFKSTGAVESAFIHCDGVAELKSHIRAGKLEVDGVVNVKGGTKIEATEIECDGVINLDGEISADIINADGYISAKEIVGDKIIIKSHSSRLTQFFTKWKHSKIDLIEATTVELKGVTARSVNGKDISIGPRCRIQKIDCSGTLYIHKNAEVKEITGEYTRKEYI